MYRENYSVKIRLYDLFKNGHSELMDAVKDFLNHLGYPGLIGPFHSMMHEIAVNALKAVYKKLFFAHFIEEIGLGESSYEDWLSMFRSEIELHHTDNFARMARDSNMGADLRLRATDGYIKMTAVNVGTPSEVELDRIIKSIQRVKFSEETSILDSSDEADENHKEGGGLGIYLVVMTLRNLGAPDNCLKIYVRKEQTIASIKIPRALLGSIAQKLLDQENQ